MDLTPFLQLIAGIITIIITSFVIPFIKSKTTAQQRAALITVVETVVKAAEQMKELTTGQSKYDYVASFLASKGFAPDSPEIKALIEAAVYEVKNAFIFTETIEGEDNGD